MTGSSAVASFYKGKSVLLTGGTGFLGHVIAEKLLRSCPGLKTLYLLVRSKGGKDPSQRVEDMLKDQFFDRVRCEMKNIEDKIIWVTGDASHEGLGLDREETNEMVNNVDVVIHSAASINMKEPLKKSVAANLVSTREMVRLAKKLKKLQSFVYISTAYSHCNRELIEEKFYPVPVDPQLLCELYRNGDDNAMKQIEPSVIQGKPNVYVSVKALGEELVRREMDGMPACVFRPAMISATRWEPMPGWMNNWASVSGILVQVYRGALRTMCIDLDAKFSLVPVDMTANAIIVAATKNRRLAQGEDLPVYNFTTTADNTITGRQLYEMSKKFIHQYPTLKTIDYPNVVLTKSMDRFRVLHTFRDLLPAAARDLTAAIMFRRRRNIKRVLMIEYFMDSLRCFMVKGWDFDCGNVSRMWTGLELQDKKTFPFDMRSLLWEEYTKDMIMGARLYLLTDPPSTCQNAKMRMKWLYCKRPLVWIAVFGFLGKIIFF